MKLADYAKSIGISYQTAWRHYKAGKIPYPTKQLASGTVIVDYNPYLDKNIATYCSYLCQSLFRRK